jgi:N utilization substance protein B
MNDTTTPTPRSKPAGDMRRASARAARSRARSFAVQALYQILVGRNEADDVDAFAALEELATGGEDASDAPPAG